MKKYYNVFLFLVMVVAVAGCGQIPSNEAMYKLASAELEKWAANQGTTVQPAPFEEVNVSVGKNGGWVELPCTVTTASGKTQQEVKVVWLKRVARTWTVEKIEPRTDLVKPTPGPSR